MSSPVHPTLNIPPLPNTPFDENPLKILKKKYRKKKNQQFDTSFFHFIYLPHISRKHGPRHTRIKIVPNGQYFSIGW